MHTSQSWLNSMSLTKVQKHPKMLEIKIESQYLHVLILNVCEIKKCRKKDVYTDDIE